jgi:hypothetical protein
MSKSTSLGAMTDRERRNSDSDIFFLRATPFFGVRLQFGPDVTASDGGQVSVDHFTYHP